MFYVLLIYEPEPRFEDRGRDVADEFWAPWRAYHQALVDAGVYVGGTPLESAEQVATTVRVRGGDRHVQDGPYADTKEQLGGFIIVDLPSLDAALAWGARCPAASYGAIEIRPAADLDRIFGAGQCGVTRKTDPLG